MSREQRLHHALFIALKPVVLFVENESSQHQVPPGSETHFKVVIVTDNFCDKSLIERQRMVHALLSEELNSGLHALTMQLYTCSEWEKTEQTNKPSPLCHRAKKD